MTSEAVRWNGNLDGLGRGPRIRLTMEANCIRPRTQTGKEPNRNFSLVSCAELLVNLDCVSRTLSELTMLCLLTMMGNAYQKRKDHKLMR